MAPNLLGKTASLFLEDTQTIPTSADPVQIISKSTPAQAEYPGYTKRPSQPQLTKPETGPKYRWQIVWKNVLAFIYLHSFGIYGMYLFFFVCSWKTAFFAYFMAHFCGIGVTAGAHRLWAHRSYKANLPLRIILCLQQTLAVQNSLYEWVRDHRVHHKFTDTDADPHNAKRGFFFSHIGWLMVKKHKDVINKGKTVDMSDLEADPVIMFQKKYYMLLVPVLSFVMPTLVPWYFWNEPLMVSWHVATVFRYILSLNITWLVNSAAHIWGYKPYDKEIGPTENVHVAFWALGEGWHNYHHVFPWDYKASELGYHFNPTTRLIDFFAKLGWAYDLKTVPMQLVKRRAERTGDGSWKEPEKEAYFQKACENNDSPHNLRPEDMIWGWGDKDMDQNEIEIAKKYNKIE